MSLFPMFLKLEGRSCVVVGAGRVGESKIRSLLTARAKVQVVAPSATPTVSAWAQSGVVEWSVRPFQAGDLDSAFVVVAATSSVEVNEFVYREAQVRRVLCNVVDDPERCDFYYPAVVRRGDLQVAISTGGNSPALAQRLRREFERQLAPLYAGWLEELGRTRRELLSHSLDTERRRAFLHLAACREAFEAWHRPATAPEGRMNGKVYLVGAGPGDPELLTIKALKALQVADVVLHDDLVSSEILDLIPATAHVRNVGKRCGRSSTRQEEINAQLVAFASFGLTVVRLKGGDPLIFGRAGEEMDALCKANVDFEVIPGVTSALASAAAARVSLTHRKISSAVIFLSGHQANDHVIPDWKSYVSSGATLAIYMPGFDYQQTTRQLIAAGMKPETPCAIVSCASSGKERVHRTSIQELPLVPNLPAPTLLLVGDVIGRADVAAAAAEPARWFPNVNASDSPAVVPDAFVDDPGYLSQLGANL